MSESTTNSKESKFRNTSMGLFFLLMIANFVNFLFQIITGKMLIPEDYGTLNTLLSLVNIIGTPTALLSMLAAKYTAHYCSLKEPGAAVAIDKKLLRISVYLSLICIGVGFCLSWLINNFLHIDSVWLVILCFCVAATNYSYAVPQGTLQGTQKFTQYGIQNIIISVVKLLFSIVFILLGMRIGGILFAFILCALAATLFGMFSLRSFFAIPPATVSHTTKDMRNYGFSVLSVQIALALLYNIDMILVKAFSNNQTEVGLYSSGMVISKIPIYLVTAIVAVLFPLVSEKVAQKKSTLSLFVKAILYGFVPSFLFSVFLVFLGDPVLQILFGSQYANAASLFLPICCFSTLLALLNIEINYFTALAKTKFITISLFTSILIICSIVALWHPSIPSILYTMSSVLLIAFLLNFFMAFIFQKEITKTA